MFVGTAGFPRVFKPGLECHTLPFSRFCFVSCLSEQLYEVTESKECSWSGDKGRCRVMLLSQRSFAERGSAAFPLRGPVLAVRPGSSWGSRGARVVLGRCGRSEAWQAALPEVGAQRRAQMFKLKKKACSPQVLWLCFPVHFHADEYTVTKTLLCGSSFSCSCCLLLQHNSLSFACSWEYSALL